MKVVKLLSLIKAPPSENYIKNSSRLVSGLFIVGGILYYPTNGYGTVIALVMVLIVMFGQKLLLAQANQDFVEMYTAQKMFEATKNQDYLRFIIARSDQMLNDNKVLSDKAKREIAVLRGYVADNILTD